MKKQSTIHVVGLVSTFVNSNQVTAQSVAIEAARVDGTKLVLPRTDSSAEIQMCLGSPDRARDAVKAVQNGAVVFYDPSRNPVHGQPTVSVFGG